MGVLTPPLQASWLGRDPAVTRATQSHSGTHGPIGCLRVVFRIAEVEPRLRSRSRSRRRRPRGRLAPERSPSDARGR